MRGSNYLSWSCFISSLKKSKEIIKIPKTYKPNENASTNGYEQFEIVSEMEEGGILYWFRIGMK